MFAFFSKLIFYTPVFNAYLTASNQVSINDITFLFSLYSFAVVIFEIPAGIFCDKFGEKTGLITFSFLFAVSTTMFLSHNFILYIAAEIIFAIAQSILSGTLESYMFTYCKHNNILNRYDKMNAQMFTIQWISIAISFILCSLVSLINESIPFFLTIGSGIMCIFISMLLPRIQYTNKTKNTRNNFDSFKDCIIIIRGDKSFRKKVLSFSLICAIFISTYNIFQPFLMDIEINLVYNGLIYFISTIFASIGSFIYSKLIDKLNKKLLFYLIIFLLVSVFIVFLFFQNNFIIISSFCIFRLIWGLSSPLFSSEINLKLKNDQIRNTMLSTYSFMSNLISGTILLLFSYTNGNFCLLFILLIVICFTILIYNTLFTKRKII